MSAPREPRKLILDALGLLDEKGAPTESGGVELSLVGRIRALWSTLVIEGNQRAGRLEAEVAALRADLTEANSRVATLTAVAEAARPFADDQTCLDPDCNNKVCVLNKALTAR